MKQPVKTKVAAHFAAVLNPQTDTGRKQAKMPADVVAVIWFTLGATTWAMFQVALEVFFA